MEKNERMELVLRKLKCGNCGYEWYPRQALIPRQCPQCKVYNWHKPRKKKTDENNTTGLRS